MRLVEACFPKGKLGASEPGERLAFLRDRAFVDGIGLSTHDAETTILATSEIDSIDWLEGTVEALYGTRKEMVIDAIISLGPSNADETPSPGDSALEARVDARFQNSDLTHPDAVLREVLEERDDLCSETKQVLSATAPADLNDESDLGIWLAELAKRLVTRQD